LPEGDMPVMNLSIGLKGLLALEVPSSTKTLENWHA
jgi:hypothetical protein